MPVVLSTVLQPDGQRTQVRNDAGLLAWLNVPAWQPAQVCQESPAEVVDTANPPGQARHSALLLLEYTWVVYSPATHAALGAQDLVLLASEKVSAGQAAHPLLLVGVHVTAISSPVRQFWQPRQKSFPVSAWYVSDGHVKHVREELNSN